MLVWTQVCAGLAQYWNLSCLNEATNYSCNDYIFLWGQMVVRMIFVCKIIPLSTNIFGSMIFNHSNTECFISYESVMDSLDKLFLAFLLELLGRKVFPVSRLLPYLCPWGRPFLMTYSGIEKRSIVYLMNCRLAPLPLREKCPHVQ